MNTMVRRDQINIELRSLRNNRDDNIQDRNRLRRELEEVGNALPRLENLINA